MSERPTIVRRGLQRNPTIRQPRRRVSVHPVIPETNDVVAARLLPVSAEEHLPRRPGRPRRTRNPRCPT